MAGEEEEQEKAPSVRPALERATAPPPPKVRERVCADADLEKGALPKGLKKPATAAKAGGPPIPACAGLQPIDEKADYDARPFALEASVTKYSKRKEPGGGKVYTVYAVEARLGGTKWVVERRYNDWAALHNQLEAHEFLLLERESLLPDLPPSRYFGNLATKFVMERLRLLDEYISSVLQTPRFAKHTAVLQFLDAPPEVREVLAPPKKGKGCESAAAKKRKQLISGAR